MVVVLYGILLYLIVEIFNLLFKIHRSKKVYTVYFIIITIILGLLVRRALGIGFEALVVTVILGFFKFLRGLINWLEDKEETPVFDAVISLAFLAAFTVVLVLLNDLVISISDNISSVTGMTMYPADDTEVLGLLTQFVILFGVIYAFELFQKIADIGVDLTYLEFSSLPSMIITILFTIVGIIFVFTIYTADFSSLEAIFSRLIAFTVINIAIVLVVGITDIDDFNNYNWLIFIPTAISTLSFVAFLM